MGFEPILRGPQPRVLNPSHYGHTWCWRMDSNHRLPLCKRGTLAGLSYASELLAGEPGLAPGTHGFGDRQFALAYSPVVDHRASNPPLFSLQRRRPPRAAP